MGSIRVVKTFFHVKQIGGNPLVIRDFICNGKITEKTGETFDIKKRISMKKVTVIAV